jgi:hypothetical protein
MAGGSVRERQPRKGRSIIGNGAVMIGGFKPSRNNGQGNPRSHVYFSAGAVKQLLWHKVTLSMLTP